ADHAMVSSARASGRPDTTRSARQPDTTWRPSVERTGRATRSPVTSISSRTRADQFASAVSATGRSTTAAPEVDTSQPVPEPATTGTAGPSVTPNAPRTCSGTLASFTPPTLPTS